MHPLNLLNQEFYKQIGNSFHQTRQQAWPGWAEALPPIVDTITSSQSPVEIADIGCGNGRFAEFLNTQLPPEILSKITFTGIDTDKNLLSHAGKLNLQFSSTWQEADAMETNWQFQKPAHIITAFGILHHLPTTEIRNTFFVNVHNHLDDNGIAILAAWRFDRSARFAKSIVPSNSSEMDELAQTFHFSPSTLGANDYLIDWDKGGRAIRFVHIFEDKEIAELCKNNKLQITHLYDADGKEENLNRYVIVRKTS